MFKTLLAFYSVFINRLSLIFIAHCEFVCFKMDHVKCLSVS